MRRWFQRIVLSRRWLTGYLSIAAYLVFDACKLVHDLTDPVSAKTPS